MDTVFTSRNKIRLILLALVMAILVGLGAIVLHDLFDFLWEDILHTVPALQRSGFGVVFSSEARKTSNSFEKANFTSIRNRRISPFLATIRAFVFASYHGWYGGACW